MKSTTGSSSQNKIEIIDRHSTSKIKDLPHRFPKSNVTANQEEFDRVKLNIVCGTLPDDLQGHIFIVAPGGSVDSKGLPYPNGDALLNGDGMVVRLDFDRFK